MTQLVELRDAQDKFDAAGIKFYAISYDEPAALAEFAKHHDINFPLLSDSGSKVIRQLGILNEHVTPDQVPFYGIPFPGTFLLDENGLITDKLFHRNLAARDNAETMIDSVLGEILLGEDAPQASAGDDDTKITAAYHGGGGTVKTAVVRQLVVRFELAPGLHIYDAPVPEGMVALEIEVSGPEGLHSGEMTKPPTHSLNLPGLSQALNVWEGKVDFSMPTWVDDRLVPLVGDLPQDHVKIDVSVRFQACDDQVCHIPQTRTLQLSIPVAPYTAPSMLAGKSSLDVSTMDAQKFMRRKVLRGLLRSPLGGMRFLKRTKRKIAEGPLGRRKK